MFQNAREIFQVFGFKVRVDPSWFILAALIVWSLSTSYFPGVLPNASQNALILISAIAMVGLFASLILHELAHSLVARKFNLSVGNITLFIFGGVAELERDPDSAVSEFWIALAGPAMSFMLSFVFLVLSSLFFYDTSTNAVAALLRYLSVINLVLAVFNLIPAFPLDGGRVLRAVLWHFSKDVVSATKTASGVGNVFAFALMFLGIFSLFYGQSIAGIWQVLIGLFILGASRSAYSDLVVSRALENFTVGSVMTREPWIVDANDNLTHLVENIMLKRNVSFVPVLEGDELLGYVDAAMIQTIDKDNWSDTLVGDIFARSDAMNTTQTYARAEDVFKQMVKTANRKLLVVENGQLKGVISLADLVTFLSIRSELGLWANDNGPRKKNETVHA